MATLVGQVCATVVVRASGPTSSEGLGVTTTGGCELLASPGTFGATGVGANGPTGVGATGCSGAVYGIPGTTGGTDACRTLWASMFDIVSAGGSLLLPVLLAG